MRPEPGFVELVRNPPSRPDAGFPKFAPRRKVSKLQGSLNLSAPSRPPVLEDAERRTRNRLAAEAQKKKKDKEAARRQKKAMADFRRQRKGVVESSEEDDDEDDDDDDDEEGNDWLDRLMEDEPEGGVAGDRFVVEDYVPALVPGRLVIREPTPQSVAEGAPGVSAARDPTPRDSEADPQESAGGASQGSAGPSPVPRPVSHE